MSSTDPQQLALVQSLFVQHAGAVRGFALALMADSHRANDIVQETFLTATAKAAAFTPGTNFRAWVFAIARNKVLQALDPRSAGRTETLSPEIVETLCAEADDAFSAHDVRLPALDACIDQLAPQARRAVVLRYQHARKPPQIAEEMGWSLGAVNVALSRARNFLRDCVNSQMASQPAQP